MNKYKAKKTVVDGITFDSKKEAEYYQQIKMHERSGNLKDVELQPRFDIIVNGKKIAYYKADFRFYDLGERKERVIDVKGYKGGPAWSMFRLKKKLVEALYGIEIEVV